MVSPALSAGIAIESMAGHRRAVDRWPVCAVADRTLYVMQRGTIIHVAPLADDDLHSVLTLAQIAEQYQARGLWLLCNSDLPTHQPQWWPSTSERRCTDAAWRGSFSHAKGSGHASSARLHRLGSSSPQCFVVDLGRDSRWPWHGVSDPHQVLASIYAVESSIGIPLSPSPADTGMGLLRRTQRATPGRLQRPDPLAIPRTFDRPLHFIRPLNDDERQHRYVHFFDANAAYLAAARNVRVGCGAPVRTTEWDEGAVGLWRIEAEGAALGSPSLIKRNGWYDTATARVAVATGQPIRLAEGIVWPEHHRVFRRWSNILWRAREMFAEPLHALAKAGVKAIYTQTIGRFAQRPRGSNGGDGHRPDWQGAITAEWARQMWERYILLTADGSGVRPFLIYTDELAFTSDSESPAAAAPGLLEWWQGLGGFKHSRTLPLTEELIAQADAGNVDSFMQTVKQAMR